MAIVQNTQNLAFTVNKNTEWIADTFTDIAGVLDGQYVYVKDTDEIWYKENGNLYEVTKNHSINTNDTILISDLRNSVIDKNRVLVIDEFKEGWFLYDPLDTTSSDNTGTVLVDDSGKRFKRVYEGLVNVKWFGAKGDNVNDDLLAIQTALDLHTKIYLPKGNYKISGTIVIDGSNTIIEGDSPTGTTINLFGDGDYVIRANTAGFISGVVIRNLKVREALIDGISLTNVVERSSLIENVISQVNGRHGFYLSQCHGLNLIQCEALANTESGFYLNHSQATNIDKCRGTSNKIGLYLGSDTNPTGKTSIINSWFEANSDYQAYISNVDGFIFDNCWFETHSGNNTTGKEVLCINTNRSDAFVNGTISNNYFGATYAQNDYSAIHVEDGAGIRIYNNRVQGAKGAAIKLSKLSQNCHVYDNTLQGYNSGLQGVENLGFRNYIERHSTNKSSLPFFAANIQSGLSIRSAILHAYPQTPTPTVTPIGTTGATTYTYYIAPFENNPEQSIYGMGHGARSTDVQITNGNSILNSTNFNRISFTGGTGVEGYTIFRGTKFNAIGYIYTSGSTSTFTFDDIGQETYNIADQGDLVGGLLLQEPNGAHSVIIDKHGVPSSDIYRLGINPLFPIITNGNGSPEGVITAGIGSIYINRTGGAGTTLYIKESGYGNTGWSAK